MMKIKKKKVRPVAGFILLAVFILFTVLVKIVDVKAVGPQGSSVGFASLNGALAKVFAYREFWYKLTQAMGWLALAAAAGLGCVGLYQLVKRKSLAGVDAEILITGVYFVIVMAVYVLFEKAVVNYRPVLEDGKLEASYPSSHTVLALCVMASLMLLAGRYLEAKQARIAGAVCAAFMVIMTAGRLLSGVHWFTDIVGGVLISASLISLYSRALRIFAGAVNKSQY